MFTTPCWLILETSGLLPASPASFTQIFIYGTRTQHFLGGKLLQKTLKSFGQPNYLIK